MFNKKIQGTPLTQGIANDFFRIAGDSFNGDLSFLATLRGLLYRRSRDTVVDLGVSCVSAIGARAFTDAALAFRNVTPTPIGRNTLTIRSMNGNQDDFENIYRLYDSSFCTDHPNYREMQDLRLFVLKRGKLNARFYVNEKDRETIVLCNGLSLPTYHLLQSLIPRLLPWFFTETPLDETEAHLLESLTYRTSAEYERTILELAERIDLRDFAIRKLIGDFEKSGRREEMQKTQNEIERCRAGINNLQEQYRQYLQTLDDLSIRLSGQEMALASAGDNSELVDYFSCNRNVMPTGVRARTLEFTVKTFFESFDPDQYDTYIRNEKSCLYQGYNYPIQFAAPETRRKFLNAIFLDNPILKVKMCSNYIIDLRGSSSAHEFYAYGDDFIDYIPNPHIQHYACLGNYRAYINRAIQNGNLIGAIEQCVASAKSLNLAESNTTRYFLNDVFDSRHKIIRLPDGRDATPLEALDYLNSLDEAKEENDG